jgi:hypothetical protein
MSIKVQAKSLSPLLHRECAHNFLKTFTLSLLGKIIILNRK